MWETLKRWERRELGQDLRQMGLSYREIAAIIPVSKGTLSGWCCDIELSEEMRKRLKEMMAPELVRRELGQRRRAQSLLRKEKLRAAARGEAKQFMLDPLWAAGVVAYWSEGTKRSNLVQFANSDPELVRLFLRWAARYLEVTPERIRAQLHLHGGQDETERKGFWSSVIGIAPDQFGKSFIKPEGTGHRKNILYNGTISIRIRRSSDMLQRIFGWTEAVAANLGR